MGWVELLVVIRASRCQSHSSGEPDCVRRWPAQEIEIGNQLRQDDRELDRQSIFVFVRMVI
jgi:hypothetical protein